MSATVYLFYFNFSKEACVKLRSFKIFY